MSTGTGCVDPTCRCTINHSAAFALVWLSLLAVGLSVFGTIVMKRNRTPMMIGAFVGIVVMPVVILQSTVLGWTLCFSHSLPRTGKLRASAPKNISQLRPD